MFDIEENLKQLPASPGVYIHKDDGGNVIYVGKASSLRNRVRQYFRPRGQDAKTAALASHITEFEYIVTQTEAEALLLENTLIKRYRPRYNIMLRDDKTYPYIKITLGEEWPRLLKTRILAADGSKYFGPYADVGAVNRIIELLNNVYRLKRCAKITFPKGHRPCLQGHLFHCRRMCEYEVPAVRSARSSRSARVDENRTDESDGADRDRADSREALHAEYMADIDRIIAFLKGHSAEVEKYITAHMNEASGRLAYEEAAEWRDYLSSARAVTEKQRVELLSSGSMDIVLGGPVSGGGAAQGSASVAQDSDGVAQGSVGVAQDSAGVVQGSVGVTQDSLSVMTRTVTVFFVRDGKLVGRERHLLDSVTGDSGTTGDSSSSAVSVSESTSMTVAAFISQYYANQSQPPKEILLEKHIPDEQLIADALSAGVGYKVKILVPERGAKKELVRLAQNDVNEAARREEQRRDADEKKRARLHEQLKDVFGGMKIPEGGGWRIEAYDISHTGGADSVGAMVVFADGKPDKSCYRRFKIRGEAQGDDYAAMQEVLYRRLRRGLNGDKSFLPLPDFIFIDGGKGHVTATLQIIGAMTKSEERGADLTGIRVAGMVKDEHHRTRALVVPTENSGVDFTEYGLDEKRELLHLTGAIQEEVHRFTIEFHRKRRDKRMIGEK